MSQYGMQEPSPPTTPHERKDDDDRAELSAVRTQLDRLISALRSVLYSALEALADSEFEGLGAELEGIVPDARRAAKLSERIRELESCLEGKC